MTTSSRDVWGISEESNLKDHYDVRRKKLNPLAFHKSNAPGFSLFERQCLAGKGTTVCKTLKQKKLGGKPPVFHEFAGAIHPDGTLTLDAASCHVNCAGVPLSHWDRFHRNIRPPDIANMRQRGRPCDHARRHRCYSRVATRRCRARSFISLSVSFGDLATCASAASRAYSVA